MKQYMGIDQYGTTYHGLTYPAKDLKERIGRGKVSKIYRDTKSGKTYHVGYSVGPYWVDVYEVIPFRKEVR